MQAKNWLLHLYLIVEYQEQKVGIYIWRTDRVKYTMSLSPQTQRLLRKNLLLPH